MADVNKSTVQKLPGLKGSHGKVQRAPFNGRTGTMELAAAAQNDVIYLQTIPANARVDGIGGAHDALGANTGLTIKLINKSDLADVTGGGIATIADTSSAARITANAAFHPIVLTEDAWLVAIQSGAGSATGTLSGYVDHEHLGNL